MGHEANSPSVWFRRRLCPGSKRMEAQYPDTDNEHSLRGTACHDVAEQCLRENKTPGYFLNQEIRVTKADGTLHTHVFNAEDNEAVWAYVNYVARRMDELSISVENPVGRLVEIPVDPGVWLGGRSDMKGRLDCAFVVPPQEVEVIDYKHGSGIEVDPTDNDQLSEYAIGVLATLDWNTTPHDMPVKLTVVQPRCPSGQGPIRHWIVPASYFFDLARHYQADAILTDDPEAPLIAGEIQCRFCKARHACPAVRKEALSVFENVTQVKNEVDPGIYAQTPAAVPDPTQTADGWGAMENALGQPPEMLSVAQRVAIKDKAPMIHSWLKAVDESLLKDALDGVEVPNYKLVRGRSNRKWGLDSEPMIRKLAGLRDLEKKVIGKEAVCTIQPLSVAQAEKLIKPRVSGRVWKNLEKHIIKPEGAPTLAPLTDPRPPIGDVTTVFQPVAEQAETSVFG